MAGPLSGVRVLDLTHVLNGPFCTMLLAHLGAEVLKLEHGSGDRFRHAWMPPDAKHDGYEFLMVNSNKKGITLNLKQEKGCNLFRELVKKSDVLAENFTVGVMDRLGFGYDALRELNPRSVPYTSLLCSPINGAWRVISSAVRSVHIHAIRPRMKPDHTEVCHESSPGRRSRR